jgi:hypothetical protein
VAANTSAVERSRAILGDLIRERGQLRARGGETAALEANRLAICYWRQRLSSALVRDQLDR